MSESSLRLSVAMIVRDEEEELPGCLDNIKQFADEIPLLACGILDRMAESK